MELHNVTTFWSGRGRRRKRSVVGWKRKEEVVGRRKNVAEDAEDCRGFLLVT